MSATQEFNFSNAARNITLSGEERVGNSHVGLFWISQEVADIDATKMTLRKVTPPILILLGTVGNILGIAVLHRSSALRQSSVCYYLKAFFVASLLVLYVGIGLDWICLMFDLPRVWNVTDGLCRIWHFFCNVVIYSPIWFCVAMAIDRYISVCHQRTAETFCNLFSAKISIISIQVGLILVSIHAMWTYELHMKYGCWIPRGREDFHSVVWPWVSVIIYTFLPLSFLALFSIILFCGICSQHKCQNSNNDQRPTTSGMLTIAALSVAFTYLLFALPATIMNVYISRAPPSWIPTHSAYLRLELLSEIFQQLAILNHAVMGFVCFCSSSDFRKATFRLCLKKTERASIELSLDECSCKYRPSNGSTPVIHADNCQL